MSLVDREMRAELIVERGIFCMRIGVSYVTQEGRMENKRMRKRPALKMEKVYMLVKALAHFMRGPKNMKLTKLKHQKTVTR